jgi:hypothetical protein
VQGNEKINKGRRKKNKVNTKVCKVAGKVKKNFGFFSNIILIYIYIYQECMKILTQFILFSFLREGNFTVTSGSFATHETFSNTRVSS